MSAYGIMGGTFDPVHLGHLLVAERAREEYNLQRVVFVPSGRPAHKKDYAVTPAEIRWEMVCEAIRDNDAFEPSRTEIDRSGISYAVDTIAEMLARWPGEKPYFITGVDAVLEILTWHRADELPELTEFVAAARPGFKLEQISQELPPRFVERIHLLRVPLVDISSTAIRTRASRGQSVRYMVPERVWEYMSRENLYSNTKCS